MFSAPTFARSNAASKYAPDHAHVLFVAESPPQSDDRYFYFENVKRDDWLWIALMRALYGPELKDTKTERQRKTHWLARFQRDGFRVIDAVKEPLAGSPRSRVAAMRAAAPALMSEIREIAPEYIVLIKATVHEALFQQLREKGFPVINEQVLPFPAVGQQRRFLDGFRQLIISGKLPMQRS